MEEAVNTVSVEPDIGNLTRSLRELWEKAENADPEAGLARSLTQNLIVVTDEEHAEEMRATVDCILTRHPCRAIIVVLVEENFTDLRGELVAGMRMQGRCRALVLERLTITSDWSHYRKLPNLIRPLLVNDIPTCLFWAAQLPESHGHISAMASMADRTVVDSMLFRGDDWRGLAQLVDPNPFDLSWLRLTPWRRLLAEAFEHFEWEEFEPATTVVLEHGPTYGSLGAARCLEHWLTCKLDADVRLVKLPGNGPEGEPWRLDLTHGEIHIQIRHLMTEPRLRIELTLGNRCLLPNHTMASRGERADLLGAAIDSRQNMRF